MRCRVYNFKNKNDFSVEYKNGCFNFKFQSFEIKFYDDRFYEMNVLLKSYLKNYQLKSGDYVVDAGAYIGAFAVYAAKVVGDKGKVIAFEPDPDSYEKLQANVKLNDLKNIIVVKKGLWSQSTKLNFYNDQGDGSSFIYDENGRKKPIRVDVVRLDEELKSLGIKKINFIKMDIEGAELEAIQSLKEWLKNQDIHLSIASYHLINNEPTSVKLEKMLKGFGFKVQTSRTVHITTYASNQRFFGSRDSRHIKKAI